MLFAQANQVLYALPLIASISLVYSATRHEDMPSILTHALSFGSKVVLFMLALGGLLWLLGKGL
jgi:hypothetical protein